MKATSTCTTSQNIKYVLYGKLKYSDLGLDTNISKIIQIFVSKPSVAPFHKEDPIKLFNLIKASFVKEN